MEMNSLFPQSGEPRTKEHIFKMREERLKGDLIDRFFHIDAGMSCHKAVGRSNDKHLKGICTSLVAHTVAQQ